MDPVTIITATLSFTGAVIQSYNVIKEIKDLPEAFKEVERQLPPVQRILTDVRQRLTSSQITDADKTILRDQILPCEQDAKTLNDIIEKLAEKLIEDQNDTKTWAKALTWYREVPRGMKARQVESLMKRILERVKLLALQEVFGLHNHLNHITEALDRLSKVDASLERNSQGQSGSKDAATKAYITLNSVIRCIPFNENENFVGRADILEKLRGMLIGKQRQRVALHGLGGVGKTQTALSLAYWVQANMPEYSVFWLSALSIANFERSCRDTIERIGLTCLQDQKPQDVLRSFLNSERSGLWLLVVDNADDEKIIYGQDGVSSYLPSPRSKGSLIAFTTRSRKVARELSNYNMLQLQEMNKDEAQTLLETLLGPGKLQDEQATIISLLEELTYLPLAINHAAAYIDQNRISAKGYIDLMRNSERDLIEVLSDSFSSDGGEAKSHDAVATTWLLSFERIQKSDPQAGVLLEFLSQIEPKAIPRPMLPEFETKQQHIRAIGTLTSYAFITERSNEMFDMHSLVHLGAKVWVERQGQEHTKRIVESSMIRLAVLSPNGRTPFEDGLRWGQEYFPHAMKLLKASENLSLNSEPQVFFYGRIGRALLFCLRRDEGIRLVRQGLQLAEDGDFHRLLPHLQYTEANGIVEAKNLEVGERAVELAQRAVDAFKLTDSAEQACLLYAQLILASSYIFTNQKKDAIALIHSVLALWTTIDVFQQTLGFLVVMHLAKLLHEINLTFAAIDVLEKTIEKHGVFIGRYSPELLEMQVQLARLYLSLSDNNIQKGVDLLEHTWKAATSYYGRSSHPKVIQAQTLLGWAHNTNGQKGEALKLLKEVVEICEHDAALANSSIVTKARLYIAEYAQGGPEVTEDAKAGWDIAKCEIAGWNVAEYAKAGIWSNMLLKISSIFKSVSSRLIWNEKGGKKMPGNPLEAGHIV